MLRGKGAEIKYAYDSMYRLIKIDYPFSVDTEYTYGPANATDGTAGRIAQVKDETGHTEYEYGLLGETTRETRTITRLTPTLSNKDETRATGYKSNYLGQMEQITFDDGEVVTYTYNSGGQVQTVTGVKGGSLGLDDYQFPYVKDIGYDEFGQVAF